MADDPELEPDEERERIQISGAQAAASAFAAISAAVVCSLFGVAGTILGTALTSVIATIGGSLYSYSLRRTKTRLRRLHQAGAASPPFREVMKEARRVGRRMFSGIPWGLVLIGSLAVFVFSIAVVTAIEAEQGETLSALFGVSHRSDNKCSLCAVTHSKKRSPKATHSPKPTKSPSPSPTAALSPTPSATPTSSVSTTPSPTPTTFTGPPNILRSLFPSHSPTPTPTPSPSGS